MELPGFNRAKEVNRMVAGETITVLAGDGQFEAAKGVLYFRFSLFLPNCPPKMLYQFTFPPSV